MMKTLILLLMLSLAACSGLNPTRPSTPQPLDQTQDMPASTSQTSATLTAPQSTSITISTAPSPSNATALPDANSYTWQVIASDLKRPVDLQPDGSGRLFIVENPGRIRIYANGQVLTEPFLNIEDRVDDSGNEMGLLGLAVHPNFSQNGFIYVNYTGKNGDTFISRFHASGDTADPNSELILLKVKQPFPNHNGGALAFGPDGYLYIALGDGGAAGDPFGNAQSVDTLLGKILRIDVDSVEPYAIPADNPFGNEIYYYGLRNPWRISFDQPTGDLYIGDVGQGEWEEIDYVATGSRGGLNFGWNFYEGAHDYDPPGYAGEFVFPILEYSHAEGGCSIIGGYVYRGGLTEWNGVYLYGDYCTGKVWGAINVNGQWQAQVLFEAGVLITSFGQDESGEVYLLSDQGNIYKLVRK